MVNDRTHYLMLANLFRYPASGFINEVRICLEFLEKNYPDAATEFRKYYTYMISCNDDLREELFTRTFDVQPICYLDLGYVMFGEDYKRGAFLLSMQHEQKRAGNDCGTDLPDNICNVLTLMAVSDDDAFIEDLVWRIFIPCLKLMINEFNTARIDLKLKVLRKLHKAIIQEEMNTGNVYRNCFQALLSVLISDFGEKDFAIAENNVLHSAHHHSFINRQSNVVTNYKPD